MSGPTLGGPQYAKDDETTRITPTPLPLPSGDGAHCYYHGLPSRPLHIARAGTRILELPTGPEANFRPKMLRILGSHEIEEIWEKRLALEIHAVRGENKVDWSSTDVVHIDYADEYSGEIILRVGVKPGTLSHEPGVDVAQKCKEVLLGHNISDVEVEIRGSEIINLAGPRLLEPVLNNDPTVDVREPFAYSLGITICSRTTPWTKGTAGFFLEERGEGKRLFLVTARHVVLPGSGNNPSERKSTTQARHGVLILSDMSFRQPLARSRVSPWRSQRTYPRYHRWNRYQVYQGRQPKNKHPSPDPVPIPVPDPDPLPIPVPDLIPDPFLDPIPIPIPALVPIPPVHSTLGIDRQDTVVNYQERCTKELEGNDDDKSVASRTSVERVLGETKTNKKTLEAFHKELLSQWSTDDSCVLGHLIFSSPISTGSGPERFTRDVVVIKVDSSEVDPCKFRDNFIDLGNKLSLVQLTEMMYPNAKNSHSFDFPWDRLPPLHGTIGFDEMWKSTMYDRGGKRCLLVLKNGRTTRLTVGRLNNIFSFTRRCFIDDDGIAMEWSILLFSAKGDSGSVVVDSVGRIGGIFTGSGGALDSSDVTDAIPLDFVLETIHSYKPLTKAYPKGPVCLGAALAGWFPALGSFPSLLLHFTHLRPFSVSRPPMQVFYEMFHVGFQRCNFVLSAPSSLEPMYFPFRIEIISRSCVSTRG